MALIHTSKTVGYLLATLGLGLSVHAAVTDISTVPLNTYSAPSSTDVKPNIFFVLDDSGSMDSDYMPDWAQSAPDPQFRNASYNGVFYNPAIRYIPPIAVGSSGATNTTTYPSMTGAGTSTGAGSSTKPNWTALRMPTWLLKS